MVKGSFSQTITRDDNYSHVTIVYWLLNSIPRTVNISLLITHYNISIHFSLFLESHLWFTAARFVAFICVFADTERDENSRFTIYTAYPGNFYNRKLATSTVELQRSSSFICFRIAQRYKNLPRYLNHQYLFLYQGD